MDISNKIEKIIVQEVNKIRSGDTYGPDKKSAIYDIIKSNYFNPSNFNSGPYHIVIKLMEWRLIIEISSSTEKERFNSISVSLTGIRRIIRDYQIVCENYYEAIKTAPLKKVEAIDVGRKSIHDEGAEELMNLFNKDVEMDLDTARRIFTLICVIS